MSKWWLKIDRSKEATRNNASNEIYHVYLSTLNSEHLHQIELAGMIFFAPCICSFCVCIFSWVNLTKFNKRSWVNLTKLLN